MYHRLEGSNPTGMFLLYYFHRGGGKMAT